MTITDYNERTGAISNRTGSWNWRHCCKFKFHEGTSSVMVVSKMCVASCSRWFRTALFTALRLSLTFCRERFRYPTDIDFHRNPIPFFTLRRSSLLDCWQWIHRTFKCHFFWQNSYFDLRKVCLSHPLMCLDFHDYPRDENCGGKVQINKTFNAADDRRLAADKARPIGIGFSTSFAMLCG